MQLGSSTSQIPDGLLAAMTLLREKPHQGVPSRNLAPHQGIDQRNSTAALGLRASQHLNRVWPRYTGKERDTESGNDYFGARYYSSSMGRFMSPDWSAKVAPVPYAKLDNPQTLNLYAYVGNNPMSRTDPTGHYNCKGDKEQCAQFATGLNLIRGAEAKLGANTDKGKALQKVLDFYGSATDKNKVNVSFGNMAPGNPGSESLGKNGVINIKFDLRQISGVQDISRGIFSFSERAGAVEHEGTHGVDDRARGHDVFTKAEDTATEHNAYTNQSYVFEGLGTNSANGLWSPSWSAGEAEANRSRAIDESTQGSVQAWCSSPGNTACSH